MHAELVALADLVASDLAAWRALAIRAIEANPFFEPQMVMAAAAHIAEGSALGLLVVRDGRELRACVPVRATKRGRRFPFPMLAGWRHDYSFLGSPLVDRDCADEAVRALGGALGQHGVPRFLVLEQVGDGVREHFDDAASGARMLDVSERAVNALDGDGPSPIGLSGKHRRELTRKSRALAKIVEGEIVHDLPPTPAVIDKFLALEASGWKGRAGTALASQATHAEFFRDLSASFGADDRMRFITLGDKDAPVAMTATIMARETAFAFKLAVDERQGALSPGVQVMAEVPRVLFRDGVCTLVDSCADPEQETINKLWTQRRRLTTFLVSDGLVGRTVGVVAAGLSRRRSRRSAA